MSIISVNDVTKTYNHKSVPVHALAGITLTVEKGEFTAIVGPSGSGKTTLLNLIGGLDRPTQGWVVVDGTEISQMKGEDLIEFRLRHIGFVFQAYNLIPVLTVGENIEFIMVLQGVKRIERERRTSELLKIIGLSDRSHSRPAELSGGQQQRVAVARALASRPSFVLADEPTANLDSRSALGLLDLMESLNAQHKMTFLFSTHDPRVIQKARRVVTLEDGMVKSDVSVVAGPG